MNEIEMKLRQALSDFKETYNVYIIKREEYEKEKLNYIDPTIRDSVEKQLIKAYKENSKFFELFQEIERLRRELDKLRILIDGYKSLLGVKNV